MISMYRVGGGLLAAVILSLPVDLVAQQPPAATAPQQAPTQAPPATGDGKSKNPILDAEGEGKQGAAGPATRSDNPAPSGRYPAETTLQVQLIAQGQAGCEADKSREAGAGALLTAVLPKVIDVGLASLSAALRVASGEDRKTRHYTGLTTGYAYNYDPRTRERSWLALNGCLKVTSAHLESTGQPTLDALIPIRVSRDGTALAFDLHSLAYRGKLSKGRKVQQMTIAIELTNAAGSGNSIALLKGPFVPAPDTFVASDGIGPSSGWITMPAVDQTVSGLITTYAAQCDARASSAAAYIDAEIAKVQAGKDPDDKKENTIKALQALSRPDPDKLCGRKVEEVTFALPGNGWSVPQENGLLALETRLRTQQPINFTVVVTETRSVNKFLYAMSQKLEGDQPQIREALVASLDPARRKAQEEADASARRNDDKARITNASAFEQKMVAFHEKVRVYQRKSELVRVANATLVAAREGSRAEPGNQQLREAVTTASNELEAAESEKSAALAEALVAKQQALEAAVFADVTITDSHPLRRFPPG
ncbi:hypothetical protein [Luteimonas sp. SDU101]|uniref:hypothetical protein n=1 Tax=Luteimonas sp. SDU101 TaxID=3422593 RepID=UPI003EBE773F